MKFAPLVFLALFLLALFSFAPRINAETQEERDLKQKIAEYTEQIKSLQSKQRTLGNQIAQFNTQIKLTELKIQQTEDQIALLSGRIGTLTTSLSDLTKAFDARVLETYKASRLGGDAIYLVSSKTLSTALSRYEYLRRIQEADHTLLARLGKAQSTYESQKKEQEELSATLAKQKASLDGQKQAKNQLLTVTQNDEKKYQQLLQQAQAQLAAFRSFTRGATILSNQTKCDSWGCYYNQRDSQWATQTMGCSSETMKEVGCLVTSMAMVATHYGKSIKPSDIAGSNSPFFSCTAYMNQGTWSAGGVTMSRTRVGYGTGALDSELASGKPVIVGIYKGPDHFIVIKKKDGGDYVMNDPFIENGADTKFTTHYPLSAITAVDRVSVN